MAIWKDISGYEGLYQVSNEGAIKNTSTGKFLKPKLTIYGYHQISLRKKAFQVHRLVAFAFLELVEGKEFINHKDCNKTNNNVLNLEWCTRLENMDHAIKNGLIVRGERHKSSNLKNSQVRQIRRLHAKGYNGLRLSKMFSTHRKNIYDIVQNNTWKHLLK